MKLVYVTIEILYSMFSLRNDIHLFIQGALVQGHMLEYGYIIVVYGQKIVWSDTIKVYNSFKGLHNRIWLHFHLLAVIAEKGFCS